MKKGTRLELACSICGKDPDWELLETTNDEGDSIIEFMFDPHVCDEAALREACTDGDGVLDAESFAHLKSRASWIGWPSG